MLMFTIMYQKPNYVIFKLFKTFNLKIRDHECSNGFVWEPTPINPY